MTADRLREIEVAYHGARDLRGDDRSRFLDDVCGADIVMRRQIESLLRQDSTESSLLDRPAIEAVRESMSADIEPDFSGNQIGVYELLEPIGSGGMGVVYRARDTRLHREAALKFLPVRLAADPERLARFRREAQALAVLSHPNVAQVYGLEESGGTTAIAMEIVEGETLAERLRRGPLDAATAVRVAKDIAEALEAAHEKGIVHRDLKPANVMLTPQGQIKVLDFGLAKAFRSSPLDATERTISDRDRKTAAGMILGTLGYMSPEQESGAPTDHRTDVFSFGCVVYEMLTGKRALDGKIPSGTEVSTPNLAPDLMQLPRGINPGIPALVARCLERDPRRRWHAIGDARIQLEAIEKDPHGLEVRTGPARHEPLWKSTIPLLATAVLTAVIVAAIVGERPAAPSTQQTTRFSFDLAAGRQFTERGRHIIDVSRDGSRIAFVASDQLMVRDMADAAPRQLPVSSWDLSDPRFSPDGRWIAYFAGGKLWKIALSGGAPMEICEIPRLWGSSDLFGLSWDRDTDLFFGRGPRGILRVSADGGAPETVLTVNAGEVAHGPQLLPDGEHVLFTVATDEPGGERWDRAQIVVQSLKTRTRTVVVQDGSDARYVASSGHLVYAQGSTLRAVAFDANRLRVVGEPTSIVDDVRRASVNGATGAAQFGASATGTLAYIPGGVPSTNRSLALIDMNGKTTVLEVLPGLNHTPRFSFDGQQIAWKGGDRNIWIFDRTGTRAMRRLTSDGTSNAPVWTPDGRIVFRSGRDSDLGLFWQPADGSAPADRLLQTEPGLFDIPTSVSRDGQTLLFLRRSDPARRGRSNGSGREGIWMLPLTGPRAPRLLIGSRSGQGQYFSAAFSPNGQWIVYEKAEAQAGSTVYVEPFPPTGALHPIRSEQSWAPMWTPDGGRLLYLAGRRNRFFAVDILRSDAKFEYGPPKQLFDVQTPIVTFGDGGRVADMSPNGQHIVAFQEGPDSLAPPKIDVVLGWVGDLHPRQARGF